MISMPWCSSGIIIDSSVDSWPPCRLPVDVNTTAGLPDKVPDSHCGRGAVEKVLHGRRHVAEARRRAQRQAGAFGQVLQLDIGRAAGRDVALRWLRPRSDTAGTVRRRASTPGTLSIPWAISSASLAGGAMARVVQNKNNRIGWVHRWYYRALYRTTSLPGRAFHSTCFPKFRRSTNQMINVGRRRGARPDLERSARPVAFCAAPPERRETAAGCRQPHLHHHPGPGAAADHHPGDLHHLPGLQQFPDVAGSLFRPDHDAEGDFQHHHRQPDPVRQQGQGPVGRGRGRAAAYFGRHDGHDRARLQPDLESAPHAARWRSA